MAFTFCLSIVTFFLCAQRSEYADSFFEQDRGSGAMADTRFGRKIQPGAPGAEVWRFSLPTAGTDLGVAQAPVLPLRREKKQHPSLGHQVERLDEKQKCKAYK